MGESMLLQFLPAVLLALLGKVIVGVTPEVWFLLWGWDGLLSWVVFS